MKEPNSLNKIKKQTFFSLKFLLGQLQQVKEDTDYTSWRIQLGMY